MNPLESFVAGARTPSASPEKLSLLAKVASNRYLKDGTSLNEAIQKLANENSLNSHQVARVCEMDNINTHQALWPAADDKTKVAFEVANPAKITVINIKSPPPATGGGGEFMGPPSDSPSVGPSMAEMFGGDDAGHQGMTEVPEKKQIIVIMQKSAAERQVVTDDLVKLAMLYETELKNLYGLVKRAFISGEAAIEDLYAVACQEGHGDVAMKLFPKFAALLHKETAKSSLTKIAWKAPEDLISQEMPVTVVNGAHPILISLDTLKRYRDQEQEFNFHLWRIDDKNSILSQRLKELE
jgi:hypothetical protein